MVKEEFIDKIGVANKTINSLTEMVGKIQQTKREAIELYLEINKRFDFDQRVKVELNKEGERVFLGYGYVKAILADEDYGTIFYEIKKEDKQTKEETEEFFEQSKCGVHEDDFEYCSLLLSKIF